MPKVKSRTFSREFKLRAVQPHVGGGEGQCGVARAEGAAQRSLEVACWISRSVGLTACGRWGGAASKVLGDCIGDVAAAEPPDELVAARQRIASLSAKSLEQHLELDFLSSIMLVSF